MPKKKPLDDADLKYIAWQLKEVQKQASLVQLTLAMHFKRTDLVRWDWIALTLEMKKQSQAIRAEVRSQISN